MKALIITIVIFSCCVGYSQNVGIGIQTPAAPLHIKAPTFEILRLEGTNPYLSFYNGAVYKGYLWHDGIRLVLGSSTNEPVIVQANYTGSPAFFTPNGRLGLGQSNPTERLDVNGNINVSGLLKINGNSGTAGQVLTSNGAAEPSWANAAYSNNIRFGVLISASGDANDFVSFVNPPIYNLQPSVISFGPQFWATTVAGLYHLDISISATTNYSIAPTTFPTFLLSLAGLSSPLSVMNFRSMTPTSSSNLGWRFSDKVSLEVYLPAGTGILLAYTFVSPSAASSWAVNGFMTGHLISQ